VAASTSVASQGIISRLSIEPKLETTSAASTRWKSEKVTWALLLFDAGAPGQGANHEGGMDPVGTASELRGAPNPAYVRSLVAI
jgi:hypothetical protein